MRLTLRKVGFLPPALVAVIVLAASFARAQAPARFLGTITAINGTTLTVKTDAGETHQVEVPASTQIKRVEPGQKDLSSATTIQFSDLSSGDRVLVRIDPNSTGATPQAAMIVAIKQADVAAKQQQEREEWQRSGVGGLVKSVDTGSGVIVLTAGAGPTTKTVTVHTTTATVLKRYAPGSVRFDDAQPAPIDAIHLGDQLRARGQKSPDGAELTADAVVSGSFRNISGTVTSVDAANATLVVKDLATKKQVTVRVTHDAQMRRLPERMAQMLAARLKGGAAGGQQGRWNGGAQASGATAGSPNSGPEQHPGNGGGSGQWTGQNGGGDPQQMLNRAPAIQLTDLQKGEAVMLVSTEGTSDLTAITLLAGVEPLLQAPASQNLLSNWSMGGGAGAEAADAQ